MKLRLAAIAAALLLTAGAAQAWWDTGWGYRKSVTIDTTATGADVATPVTAVPVLVRLHTGNFTHFLNVTERGGDIRFLASDDQTVLKHHVERFDAINELAYIWVQVPTIQGGSNANKIWMYFGNPAGVQSEDLVGTYGPNDVLVYHYDEVSGAPQDKTANANNAAAFTGSQNTGSLIGAGARLAGSGRITINASPTLQMDAAQGWTFSTWIKIDGPQSDAVLMERVDGGKQLVLGIDGTNAYAKFVDESGTATESPRTAALTPGTWHHVALVVGGGKMSVFVDGVEGASVAGNFANMGGAISIGGASDNRRYLTAEIDETRIANVARTADYLKLATRVEGMDGTGVVYSADETPDTEGASEESHGPSTFGIILNSVFGNEEAIVEQLVIGFCGVMALVAFAVMVLKFIYLSKAKAASAKFLKAYHALGGEQGKGKTIASLYGEDDAYGDSPLFRVYKLGIDEMRKRLQKSSPSVGAAAVKPNGIEAKSIEAIRAALDATMVREGQKMNSQMVLLTIAISGGPFIGLLGTVVGVMVTFAAIAASGDVNINAIAPGMAAALLATVAGLGVAIPALFGYNYLGSMVKEVSADMHVFTDEFIARVVEQFGR
jgi:biopolymer transport protein ExbB